MSASTKETNRKRAQKIADEWEASWRRKLTGVQAKDVLNRILVDLGEDQLDEKTLNQVINDWLAEKLPELSIGSRDQYLGVIKNARQYLGATLEKDIQDVTRNELIEARNSIEKALSEAACSF